MREQHPFPPLYDKNSRVLILGSFPSVKSREQMFFYGHPQNRFWEVIAEVCGEEVPQTIEEKKKLLHAHGIALWDVIEECDIIGASDSSVKNAVPTDIPSLLGKTQVRTILCNGALSKKIYDQYQLPRTGIPAQKMPSTSPANAAWSLTRLKEAWGRSLMR